MTVPGNTLGQRLHAIANTIPNHPALADSSGLALTYGQVFQQSLQISHWLAATKPSEPAIGIFLPASVPAALANYGVTLAGRTAVNLNFTLGETLTGMAIQLCELRTILTSRAFLAKAGLSALPQMVFLEDLADEPAGTEEKLPDVDPAATACILFSSGTTGTPKGVQLTHDNILRNAEGLAGRIPPAQSDCVLGVLPFFHSFGYTFALWFPVLHGIRAVYHGSPTDARIIGELAHAHQATHFFSTPTLCQQYARKLPAHQFASLRYIIVGAEKLRDSIANEFRNHFGISLLAGYGCTELGPGVAVSTPEETRPGSVGRPLEGVVVRIADPDTLQPLPVGEQGMILINGPSRMPGYYRAPELTAQVLQDGFYITGDVGYVDSDGYLYVTDRLSRFSKVCGEMVPHLPIEEAISDLSPSVVVSVPDDTRGERLILLYANPDLTPAEITLRLQSSSLPPFWIPKRDDMHLVPAIPVLPTGKVDLRRARELAASLTS